MNFRKHRQDTFLHNTGALILVQTDEGSNGSAAANLSVIAASKPAKKQIKTLKKQEECQAPVSRRAI